MSTVLTKELLEEILELKFKEKFQEQNQWWNQELDRRFKEQRQEFERYTGALSEHFQDQVKIIAEGFLDINRRLDAHEEMIVEIKVELTTLKMDVAILKQDVAILKDDVSILKKDMKIVKRDLKKKVDYKEFALFRAKILL